MGLLGLFVGAGIVNGNLRLKRVSTCMVSPARMGAQGASTKHGPFGRACKRRWEGCSASSRFVGASVFLWRATSTSNLSKMPGSEMSVDSAF